MTAETPLQFERAPLNPGESPLTLEVPAHQAVVLVADQSSGIEKLARFALGLEPANGGRALVYGEEIARMPRRQALAFRRRVGYLPAGDGLLQNLSLTDNVALPLRFGSDLSNREIEGRVKVMLAQVRLAAVAGLRPAAVNEEQRRRAALARALAFDPLLVILQQPFDGLASRAATELLEIARGGETAEGSRRTVFVTGQDVPDVLRARFEARYRIVRGQLQRDG
jgi:ABC-type transporter Mla maintaining outer membrane lipid asymmetry ATPase subunit MlaF